MAISKAETDDLSPVGVTCTDKELSVALSDGRTISVPTWWYPRLLAATPAERAEVELMHFGIHWPQIDEDISISGLLKGAKAPGARPPGEAA